MTKYSLKIDADFYPHHVLNDLVERLRDHNGMSCVKKEECSVRFFKLFLAVDDFLLALLIIDAV